MQHHEEEAAENLDLSGLDAFATSSDEDETESQNVPDLRFDYRRVLFQNGQQKAFGDAAMWKRMCPDLNCTCSEDREDQPSNLPDELLNRAKEDLIEDGYFEIEAEDLNLDAEIIKSMAEGVLRLVSLGWHPIWLLMFDEPWKLAAKVGDDMKAISGGNEMIMDWFAWCIDSNKESNSSGWPPHRDRCNMTKEEISSSFRPDGSPKYTTVWIPLTNASTTNSCLYVVPKNNDPTYSGKKDSTKDDDANPLTKIFQSAGAFQNIRAIPKTAGSLLSFSHRLIHWGSTASKKHGQRNSDAPRIAIAFGMSTNEFEAANMPRHFLPLPPIQMRAALITGQMLSYSLNEALPMDIVEVFFGIFVAQVQHFNEGFVKRILSVPAVQNILQRRQRRSSK